MGQGRCLAGVPEGVKGEVAQTVAQSGQVLVIGDLLLRRDWNGGFQTQGRRCS